MIALLRSAAVLLTLALPALGAQAALGGDAEGRLPVRRHATLVVLRRAALAGPGREQLRPGHGRRLVADGAGLSAQQRRRAAGGRDPEDSYSIAALVRFDEITGYRRIVDISSASADRGLYNRSGQLYFWPITGGSVTPPPFEINKYVHVVLTRDAATKRTVAYADGVEQLAFDDTTDAGVFAPGSPVRFFKDDQIITGEESAGAVARIRVYEGALTAAEVAEISAKTLADLPVPEVGEDVNVQAASGRVLVAVPSGAARAAGGRASQKGLTFVPLEDARQVPVGSFLDTTRGSVEMVSATGSGTRTQRASSAPGSSRSCSRVRARRRA